jgi:peptide chain release factor subunit 1
VQLNDIDHDRLRQLAALRPPRGKVLSVYVDLDPATFGTQAARGRQITSLLDEADRRSRDDELERDAHVALRDDVARVRDYLRSDAFSAKGAHAVAIFACGPAGVFETLRLPYAVQPTVVVNDAPWLDPLVGRRRRRRCIALVSRRTLRVLLDGSAGDLREVADLTDDVHGRHEQGGWSQANYQRSIEEEVRAHVQRAAATLFELDRRSSFDVLAVGAAPELWPELERDLHPYLRERTLGRFDVDVEHASCEEALAAAQPLFDAAEQRHVEQLLGRLQAGVAAVGLEAVQQALAQRRVEALLYDAGLAEPGLETAIADALLQSAEVLALRERPELGPLGGIAAVLRF